MKIGIVGCESAKFTPESEQRARKEIRRLIVGADMVISGHSPLGGIDIWAIEEATKLAIPTLEYAPKHQSWGSEGGYRDRNLAIARGSDKVVCVTVKALPEGYQGMRFPQGCYHCYTAPEHHVKSGGCWTMREARRMGRDTELVVIE